MRPIYLVALACCAAIAAFAAPADAAGFVVRKPALESKQYVAVANEYTKVRLLEDIAVELNNSFTIPTTIGVRFAECGEPNAFYDPEARQISVCFELLENLYTSMADSYETEDELDDAVASAFLFILFHELGHALVDVLDLPITGREEDAVDQLSAWALIDNAEGDQTVLDAALSFYVGAQGDDEDEFYESDFADEHSLDKQRYYNMVCWVYGSDPEKHADFVKDEMLTEARANQCEGEYARLDTSWTRLLAEHFKAGAEDDDETEASDEEATADDETEESGRFVGEKKPKRR